MYKDRTQKVYLDPCHYIIHSINITMKHVTTNISVNEIYTKHATSRAAQAGLHTAGLHTAGLHTAGLHTAGLHTAGLHTAGLHTAGLHTAGLHTAGLVRFIHFATELAIPNCIKQYQLKD